MHVIVLSGGLGNQMFQYAFYLSKKHLMVSDAFYLSSYSVKRDNAHNGLELFRLFGLDPGKRINKYEVTVAIIRKLFVFEDRRIIGSFVPILIWLLSVFNIRIIKELNAGVYFENVLSHYKSAYYFGFWQSEKYFSSVNPLVKSTFRFKQPISDKSRELLSVLKTRDNTVSIHVRRGDYLLDKYKAAYGSICTFEYYQKALSLIKSKIQNPFFVVFSDDIQWVSEHLAISEAVYVDWNIGLDSWQDMFLMSQCRHNIIANSTFSWWGAWLNNNTDKIVIAPRRFINNQETPDLLPDSWIKL